MKKDFNKLLAGTDFETLEDAVAADIISAVPILGAVSDFMRVIDSEGKPQRILQTLDLIASPVPPVNIATPTNTIMYLNNKGILPVDLDRIENLIPRGLRKNNEQ